MKKSITILTKENGNETAMNEWKNDDSDILWAVYVKKIGQFTLTC